ncbi:hypothetical protein B1R94_17455 [Mycolicibacterium litorale]|nr:hypothetical protein B1R94_17455 [Mycolicibacterium litorale]
MVSVELTDGRRSTHRVQGARGDADDPNWTNVIKAKAIEHLGADEGDFPPATTSPSNALGYRTFFQASSACAIHSSAESKEHHDN